MSEYEAEDELSFLFMYATKTLVDVSREDCLKTTIGQPVRRCFHEQLLTGLFQRQKSREGVFAFSKIQLVVYYQCCVLIG